MPRPCRSIRTRPSGAVMEKDLEKSDHLQGRHVEVINFGVSGFGTTQELLTLEYKVWKYSPDVVLLAFTTRQ